jgi:hypothetical protein
MAISRRWCGRNRRAPVSDSSAREKNVVNFYFCYRNRLSGVFCTGTFFRCWTYRVLSPLLAGYLFLSIYLCGASYSMLSPLLDGAFHKHLSLWRVWHGSGAKL